MAAPHVEHLTYRLVTPENISFEAEPLKFENAAFELTLEDNKLKVQMKEHYATVNEARLKVEEFIRAWEITASLEYGGKEIKFNFENAKVIEREQTGLDSKKRVSAQFVSKIVITENVSANVSYLKYPFPPKAFKVTPDVETLWQRYLGYKKGREPLFSMAYFGYTVLSQYGNKSKISKKFKISKPIITKLTTLTSTLGDIKTARKFKKNQKPASEKEKKWIDEAIKKIIFQLAKSESGSEFKQLTMVDLPELD